MFRSPRDQQWCIMPEGKDVDLKVCLAVLHNARDITKEVGDSSLVCLGQLATFRGEKLALYRELFL